MSPKTLSNFYATAIKVFLFAIPFLSLYIARSMFFPYITGRNFVFRIFVEIALALWVGLIILNKEYRPKKSILLWVMAGFLLVVGLANIFGAHPYNSFWSRFERMEGYIGLLHLAAYFLILTTVLRTKRDWRILFNLFIIAGLLVNFYALFQRFGVFRAIQGGQLRVDGTIGNPTYLAAYLLFIIALAAIFFSKAQTRAAKYYYGGAGLFSLLILYFTASRGPILGLLGGVFLWLVLYLIFSEAKDERDKKRKKIVLWSLVGLVALTIIFWLLRHTAFIQNNPTLSRFANISLTEKTTRSRFMVWNMAWQGVTESPARFLFGWGQENYLYVFSKYYNPNMFDQEPWFDRAHNIVFDWLVNAGALGLLGYLSIFGASFYLLWRAFRNGKLDFSEAALIAALLAAYFIQNFFVFDNLNTYILFFAFLAYINILSRMESEPVPIKGDAVLALEKNKNYSLAAGVVVLAVMGGAIYFANLRPIQEAQSIIGVLSSTNQGPRVVMEKFQETLSYGTFGDSEVRDQFSRLAISLVDASSVQQSEKILFIQTAMQELEKQIAEDPENLKNLLFAATLYNRAAGFLNTKYILDAQRHIEKALQISPTRQTAYYALADGYILVNDLTRALDALQKAVDLAPHNLEAQANLGRIALVAGREELVRKVMAEIKRLEGLINQNTSLYLVNFANMFIAQKRFNEAIQLFELVIAGGEADPQYYADLAVLYYNAGKSEKARAHALRAVELDPVTFGAQFQEFLKKL